jgi:hypothetical protein
MIKIWVRTGHLAVGMAGVLVRKDVSTAEVTRTVVDYSTTYTCIWASHTHVFADYIHMCLYPTYSCIKNYLAETVGVT